jgi:hypothetical protein
MNTSLNRLKGALGIAGGTGFLIAGVLVALSARKYQLSGAPMPNWKGGSMSFRDGYYLSFVLVATAAAWIYFGYRSAKAAPAPEKHGPSSTKN